MVAEMSLIVVLCEASMDMTEYSGRLIIHLWLIVVWSRLSYCGSVIMMAV